jgi:YCII-related domain-containing protein
MTNYLFAYRGGSMPADEAERAAVMESWGRWFGQLGDAVVDGGNPFGASASVAADGRVGENGTTGLGGYSIVKAASLEAATELAQGCPLRAAGGSIDVYETLEM